MAIANSVEFTLSVVGDPFFASGNSHQIESGEIKRMVDIKIMVILARNVSTRSERCKNK